jgi:hypothetical protein
VCVRRSPLLHHALTSHWGVCVLHQATLAPQSVYELPGMWRDVAAFGSYGDGGHVMASETTREDVTDRVRRFVEECDYMQVPALRTHPESRSLHRTALL